MDYELCQRRHAAHHMDWSNSKKAYQTRQRNAALQESNTLFLPRTPLPIGKLPPSRSPSRGYEAQLLSRRASPRSASVPLSSRRGTPEYVASNWWDKVAQTEGSSPSRPPSNGGEVGTGPGLWGCNHLPDKCDTLRLVGKADKILARERGRQQWPAQYSEKLARTIPSYTRSGAMTPGGLRGITPRHPLPAHDHFWDQRDGLAQHNQLLTDTYGSTHSTNNQVYGNTFEAKARLEEATVSEEMLQRRKQRMKPTMPQPPNSIVPGHSGHRALLDARRGVAKRAPPPSYDGESGKGLRKWIKGGNVSGNLRHSCSPKFDFEPEFDPGASQFPMALHG